MTMEIRDGRGVGADKDHIFLTAERTCLADVLARASARYLRDRWLFSRASTCTKQPIPVLPTVHYNMGGIPTQATPARSSQSTSRARTRVVPGLFACGEAACVSVHGANRLGANSLLDLIVFGRAVSHTIRDNFSPGQPHKEMGADAGAEAISSVDHVRNADGPKSTADIRGEMQRVMQQDVSVFRTQESLDQGVKR